MKWCSGKPDIRNDQRILPFWLSIPTIIFWDEPLLQVKNTTPCSSTPFPLKRLDMVSQTLYDARTQMSHSARQHPTQDKPELTCDHKHNALQRSRSWQAKWWLLRRMTRNQSKRLRSHGEDAVPSALQNPRRSSHWISSDRLARLKDLMSELGRTAIRWLSGRSQERLKANCGWRYELVALTGLIAVSIASGQPLMMEAFKIKRKQLVSYSERKADGMPSSDRPFEVYRLTLRCAWKPRPSHSLFPQLATAKSITLLLRIRTTSQAS